MRILLLTTSFPLTPTSSSGIFVERLAQTLGELCQLHVLAPGASHPVHLSDNRKYQLSTFKYAPSKWQLLAHGGGGIPAALSSKPWLWLLLPIFMTSMLLSCFNKARRADLIFANWSICGVVAGLVGFIWRKPVVTTLRGSDANYIETSLQHRILVKTCLFLSDRVVTVSKDIANRVSHKYPAQSHKIIMIPNGVELITSNRKDNDDVDRDSVELIMIGSLIPGKSVQTALHALHNLPKEFLLTIVGDGPESASLKSLATMLGLDERVSFAGHVAPDQVPNWLRKADIFVMTSLREGRPNVILEAMAAGLPIVASDIPGVSELITPEINGKLFPVNDSNALADCLLHIRDQNLIQRFGEASRQSIIDRGLTWKNTATLYMKQFDKLT